MNPIYKKIQRLRSFLLGFTAASLLPLPALSLADDYKPLSWYERSELTPEERQGLPEFCYGSYRMPSITPLDGNQIEAESDYSTLSPSGDTELHGNVVMQQHDKILRSDQARWFNSRAYGEFEGNVSLTSPELVLEGESATADQQSGQVHFYNAQYALPKRHLRGSAEQIHTSEDGISNLKNATFTYCEPNRKDWDLAASELHINQAEGYGSAWHTRLRIGEVPIFYLPYYRFPIGDQRMTGFLNPSFSLTSQAQLEDAQIPFYWNIAPYMDATFTPHYVREHGTLIETQFRHKTSVLGDGELNYAYLDKDKTTGEKRFLVNYTQHGVLGYGWQHRWVYYNVSDDDYLNDMNPMSSVDRTTHLPRRGEIFWNHQDWSFNITAEAFQTVDPSISLSNRPYARLPQLSLGYTPLAVNDWQFQQRFQTTRFTRKDEAVIGNSNQTLTGFSALTGDRFLSDTSVSYPMEWTFGFLTPEVEYRYRHYNLHNADSTTNVSDLHPNIGSARFSLDAGLIFERETEVFMSDYTQTLEPRLFYINSPYVSGQNNIPNFDSGLLTVTYDNLFTGERFTGGDRLADLNQLSAGLTTRFITNHGLEQFRASVGQIFYFEERRVQLDHNAPRPAYDNRNNSSLLAEVVWNPAQEWSVFSTLEWDPYENITRQARTGVRYMDNNNHMASITSNKAQPYSNNNDADINQIDAAAFWAINDRWAVVGRMLYDIRDYDTPNKPRSPILESLAGIEYQNCCWRIQMLYRESSQYETDTSIDYTTRKRYGFMFSFQLKGLGDFGASIDNLMNDGIPGYLRRTYHDY